MTDQNEPAASDLLDDADADRLPDGVIEAAADSFDEAVYLRAFPDVAQAIADGICSSPLQHYHEHGRQEDRTSREIYRTLLRGRQIGGYVDFYGHNAHAGGWLFCGWSAERWDETQPVSVTAHFRGGEVSGAGITAFYFREALHGLGTGLIVFVHGRDDPLGELVSLGLRAGGETLSIVVDSNARHMTGQAVASAFQPILQAEHDSENCQELAVLLSTAGYGRLRQSPNTLDGFVDFYGYHRAAGGWFFCGWVTRSWTASIGPDGIIAHFTDGDLDSEETIAGFYARDDMEGRGIGFVMFLHGTGRPLGNLDAIEMQVRGLSSSIRASVSTQRLRDSDLGPRLRSIVGQVSETESSTTLLSLLSRQPYTGSDTLSALSDRIFLEFDEVIACPPDGLVIIGWCLAKPGVIRAIRLRSNTLNEPWDLAGGIRLQRPDVIASVGTEHGFDDARCGFVAYLPCNTPSSADLYIEIETAHREVGFRKLPAAKLTGIAAIKRILNVFDVRYNEVPRAYDATIGPAIGRLNRNRLAIHRRADMVEFGTVNAQPRFTLIIPLYGRLDFIEYQLAFLSSHAAAFDHEILYVLDDPPKQREAERLFASAHARFRLPFRALFMEENVGYGPANNAGLREARGTYVCFMNSDVFPDQPDWLEHLARSLEDHPDLGVVGPVLVYGDGSVQHDGMTFQRLPEFGNWLFPDHPGKGMRRSPPAGLSRHISITGACMLMRRDLALELDGFDESYVIGDFEDTDLCLRLFAMGLSSGVVADIQMYHLERKSQAGSAQCWRMNLTLYNAWVHHNRWMEVIETHPLRDGPVIDPSPGAGPVP
jgi:GT2 family glycosyltransferase